MQNCRMRMRHFLLALISLLCGLPAWAGHAYAQFGDVKYPAGFGHFDYVNPDAPKGGEIKLPLIGSNFDKFNPFTLKGVEPPGLEGLLFDTLLTGSMDEPATAYGLLAEDVTVSADGRSAIFRLNAKARFHDGDPVLAADVKHSFDRLTSKEVAPQYQIYFSGIRQAVVLDERTVRFDFLAPNRELPLVAGNLPVFSRKWGAGKPLDQLVTEIPIGSGPYRVGKVNFGKDISYERDHSYWARDLNVRRGQLNFDRVSFIRYKDPVAAFEAFKAGEFDYIQVYVAKDWARQYRGVKFATGELLKQEWRHENPVGFQGFIFNTRVAKFSDPRVRRAIALAMDFEWLNRQVFYGAYTRLRGYFTGSEYEAVGKPDSDEVAIFKTLRSKPLPQLLDEPVPLPSSTTPPDSLRGNLRQAKELLAQAGWHYRDGALRNEAGDAFSIEFLDAVGTMARVVSPYTQALERLGIKATYRIVDAAVYEKRLKQFEFDVISSRLIGQLIPGAELLEMFSSRAAKAAGSRNYGGISDPVVDELLTRAMAAQNRKELAATVRALDRVLRHGCYAVPHWYSPVHRVAYRAGLYEQPPAAPKYYMAESWSISTWWGSSANRTDLSKR